MPIMNSQFEKGGNKFQIINLDRAAFAYDQRCVPIALGRSLAVFGLIFALVGVLPKANTNFLWTGFGAFLFGIIFLVPFKHPDSRTIPDIGGYLTVFIALGFLANALLIPTPWAKITPIVPMDANFYEALALANSSYGDPGWMIARIVATLIGVAIGIELLISGWSLTRPNYSDRCLLVNRSGAIIPNLLLWLLDVQPGMIRYMKGAIQWLLMIAFGMLFFLLSATNIAGAPMWHNFWANVQIAECLDWPQTIAACIDQAGIGAAVSMIALAIFSILLFPIIGSRLINFARRRSTEHAAERLASDERQPILFLRPFTYDQDAPSRPPAGYDQVDLPAPSRTPMRF